MSKSYHELITLPTFEERFEYLRLKGIVGEATFGGHRLLNQMLYRNSEWLSARADAIIRDNGCDLGHPDYRIPDGLAIYVHHINPITIEDIMEHNPRVFDLDNLITTIFRTHQAIHFGDKTLLSQQPVERRPNDTCPWKG